MQKTPQTEKVIGMIVEDIDTDFARELVINCANAIPKNKNIRLVVFPGKYDGVSDKSLYNYIMLSNSIYRLAETCKIDGLIIHLGSMTSRQSEPVFLRFLENFRKIPKVFIGLDNPDLVTVNYDNESGIREAVDYLSEVEGITRFCMLGGRPDNKDAQKRRKIFKHCLERNKLSFPDNAFVYTDMTDNCFRQAETLLDKNPGTQAIFCVNDAVAKALYAVMAERKLIPGKDIYVFGFDNTHMATELKPTLASIGSDNSSLGQKAVELVISMINGEDTGSAFVPTRLFGRRSLPYEMYDYNVFEMLNVDTAFIYRMFDDCFYRYRNAYHDHGMVDLKRLFFEIISRTLFALKERYLSAAEYDELCGLVDIFFENGAMDYTDAPKLLASIHRLQTSINVVQRSLTTNTLINRLFLHIRDRAILALYEDHSQIDKKSREDLRRLKSLSIYSMGSGEEQQRTFERIMKKFSELNIQNGALYLYEKPVKYSAAEISAFPDHIDLKCVVRDGVITMIPKTRQRSLVSNLFTRSELPKKSRGFIVFYVFYDDIIYGLLVCELDNNIYERGEYIGIELGMALDILEGNGENYRLPRF